MKGVIYILTNPSFRDYVKIGYATDIEKRLKQLNRSETIPYAFRVYAIYETPSALTDKELHRLIDTLNPDLRAIETFDGKERTKEFFAMSAEDAYKLLECVAKISGTEDNLKKMKPEGHDILDEQKANEIQNEQRRGPFKFSICGIEPGEKLTFASDENIVATVVDDRRIEYNGITTSLSQATKQIKEFNHAVQGPLWWKYKGEILNDIRLRKEKQ